MDTLQDNIRSWETGLRAALETLRAAEIEKLRAEHALELARARADVEIRNGLQRTQHRFTEAMIEAQVMQFSTVFTATERVVTARQQYISARGTVDAYRVTGQSLGWLVQLETHSTGYDLYTS